MHVCYPLEPFRASYTCLLSYSAFLNCHSCHCYPHRYQGRLGKSGNGSVEKKQNKNNNVLLSFSIADLGFIGLPNMILLRSVMVSIAPHLDLSSFFLCFAFQSALK
uniref:Uncharacterized protein n=1 Tax=Trypanosoma congolense (strain IL3000) TaxID=1068625 RepID=G0UMQ5_TRYCI|nr:hypothetical protein, unlikely [Trypanosoma congolense IL3000]